MNPEGASRNARNALILVLTTLLAGCDLFGGNNSHASVKTESVVIANGGNFSDQNGFLTFYDPQSGTVSKSTDLGGFAQAIAVHNNDVYVLLNTFSVGRISVLNGTSGTVARQIQNIPNPRGIAFVDDTEALVTNLSPFGENGAEPALVSVINLTTDTVEGDTIRVGIYPEGIATYAGDAYVANSGNLGDGHTLSVIDESAKKVVGSIDLGCDGPNEVFLDPDDEIQVVCEGKVVYNDDYSEIIDQTPGQIVTVNPMSRAVVSRVVLPTPVGSGNGSQTAYLDSEAKELYVIDSESGSIYRFATDTDALAATLQVPAADDLVGLAAVAYDGSSGSLYVARFARGAGGFPDFSASGAVVVLDRNGNQTKRFTVGPSPSQIELLRTGK